MPTRIRWTAAPALAAALAFTAAAPRADAQTIRYDLAQQQLNLGDDLYQSVDLPDGFNANFSGNTFNAVTVCANGFLITSGIVGNDFNTCAIPGSALNVIDKGQGEGAVPVLRSLGDLRNTYSQVLVPYWADLNASAPGSGGIYTGTGVVNGHNAFAVTWEGVYAYGVNAPNYFQTVIMDLGNGNTGVEFNYGYLTVAPTRIGYADDGGDTGVPESTALSTGAIPLRDSRYYGVFVNGVSPFASGAISVSVITPEPTTFALAAGGLALAGLVARRRRAA